MMRGGWIDEHPYLSGLIACGGVFATGLAFGAKAGPVMPPASSGGGLVRLTGNALVATPGRTYYATVVTHGLANAASGATVAKYASDRGFTGVTASKTAPPGWPSPLAGDWFVTATFAGESPLTVARSQGSFLAGADIADVWEA